MRISKNIAFIIEKQGYEEVAKALIIREFWQHCSSENIFEFSFNVKDKGINLLGYMRSAFFNLVKEDILIQGNSQEDLHYELGILQRLKHKDSYYEENFDISEIERIYGTFLMHQGNLQYSIKKQDEILRMLLIEVYRKFGKHIQKFNLYSFLSDDEKTEYFQYTNLFLGLLRLEKEKYIAIEWLGDLSCSLDTNEYFAECSIVILDETFFDTSANMSTQLSKSTENIQKTIDIRIDSNYSLIINNHIIETTPIQKSYLRHLNLEELLDGLSLDELARRYEGGKLSDIKWKSARKRVKNSFTTLNGKIQISGIQKKDIFIISQATGISLNGIYNFQIS